MGSREDEHILALEIRCQCRFQRLPQIFDFRLAQFHFLVLNRHPIALQLLSRLKPLRSHLAWKGNLKKPELEV